MNEAIMLDPYNKDIKKAAEYHGRMSANMIELSHINGRKLQSIVRAAFTLGAAYQKNILNGKPNIVE